MQISLTQNELKDAVRSLVTKELGIDLAGKTLDISFTATRGDQGVITNLSINKIGNADDVSIPGYTDSAEPVAEAKPVKEATATEAESVSAAGQAELANMKAAQPKPPVDKGTPAPVTVATLEATAPVVAGTPTPATVDPVAAEVATAEANAVKEPIAQVLDQVSAATAAKPAATTSLFG